MSSGRVFERRIVSKRRTSANLEDSPEKQCPNGWSSVVAAASAAAAAASSSSRPKTSVTKNHQRPIPFQPHPDSDCDWFFKVSDKNYFQHICSRLFFSYECCISRLVLNRSIDLLMQFSITLKSFSKHN